MKLLQLELSALEIPCISVAESQIAHVSLMEAEVCEVKQSKWGAITLSPLEGKGYVNGEFITPRSPDDSDSRVCSN